MKLKQINHKVRYISVVLIFCISLLQLKAVEFSYISPSDSIVFDTVYDVVHSHKISVELSAGPGFSTFHFKHNQNDNEYLSKLKNSIDPRIGYTINADMILSRDRLLLKTGFGYTHFGSDFKYSTQKFDIKHIEYTETQLIDQYYIKTDDGHIDTIDVTQDVVLTRIDTSKQTVPFENENRMNYFEFPVFFGYGFPGEKLSVMAYFGIIPGILHQSNQQVIDYNDENLTYKLTPRGNEIRKFMFSFGGGLSASYQIAPEWSINLQGIYRQGLLSMYSGKSIISKYNNSLFVSFGVCYFVNEFFR